MNVRGLINLWWYEINTNCMSYGKAMKQNLHIQLGWEYAWVWRKPYQNSKYLPDPGIGIGFKWVQYQEPYSCPFVSPME